MEFLEIGHFHKIREYLLLVTRDLCLLTLEPLRVLFTQEFDTTHILNKYTVLVRARNCSQKVSTQNGQNALSKGANS